jgi:hypothetical protein
MVQIDGCICIESFCVVLFLLIELIQEVPFRGIACIVSSQRYSIKPSFIDFKDQYQVMLFSVLFVDLVEVLVPECFISYSQVLEVTFHI